MLHLMTRRARPQPVLTAPVPRSRVDLVRRPALAAPQLVSPVARLLWPGLAVLLLVFLAMRAHSFHPRRLRKPVTYALRPRSAR